MRYNTVQYSLAQYSTVQYSIVQWCDTVQYSGGQVRDVKSIASDIARHCIALSKKNLKSMTGSIDGEKKRNLK